MGVGGWGGVRRGLKRLTRARKIFWQYGQGMAGSSGSGSLALAFFSSPSSVTLLRLTFDLAQRRAFVNGGRKNADTNE